MNILFQVGRLEVEEAVFRKLKMENFLDIPEGCKVEFPWHLSLGSERKIKSVLIGRLINEAVV